MNRTSCKTIFILLSILFIVSSKASWMGIEDKWKQIILDTPSTPLLEEYLFNLTSEPHLSGTIFDYITAQYVHDKFVEFGLDAEIIKFESIISYPLSRSVSLFSENGTSVYNCTLEEAVVPEDPTSNNTNISLTYNVYSPSGNIRAPLVYVNYGREQDYMSLENLGIDVKGKIVIARYGQIFRGLKVYGAQVRGAVGILIYSDPIDDGFFQGDVYPKGPFRPETGVQEGSPLLLNICPGDPSEERLKEKCFSNETITALGVNTTLPQILVQPISYGDAKYLLESLDGNAVPTAWQGGLAFHYHYGGTNKTIVELEVEMNITKVELWNVKGYVNGSSSSQQKVMFGNHRDAWIFGAVDPSSGTSVMLELARTFGELKKQGWVPERTIVFSSWDGEEQGLIGSTYDAEENMEDYNKTLIAYLNVDTAVTFLNPVLRIGGSPILYSVIRESMKMVTDPNTGKSLYDVFSGSFGVLGSGSDYTAFLDTLGVSSADFSFSRASGDYGVYHSRYDSFYWMKHFGDPEFLYHKAMTQLLGMIGFMISTNPFLPLNQSDTASFLQSNFDSIKTQISGSFPNDADLKSINFNSMQKAIDKFQKNADLVNSFILKNENKSLGDDESLREQVSKLNEALFLTERRFLEQSGIPQRPFYKHLLQAPGLYKGYGSDVFPGITDSLSDGDFDRTADQFILLRTKIEEAADYSKGPLKSSLSIETILLIVFGVAILVILVIFISVLIHKRKKKNYEKF